MRDFFEYPKRVVEVHRAVHSIGVAVRDSGIIKEHGLFVVVLTDPRTALWVYALMGYGVAPEKIVVLTPDAELGADFFMGSGSFPALRVIIGDPLESVMEFHQKALVLVFGDTRDGVLRDITMIRRFIEVALKHDGLLLLDYPSTFLYVTPSEEHKEGEDPYERFTQLVHEFDRTKPAGSDNAYEVLMVESGLKSLEMLYGHLDQGSPRMGLVATNVIMGFDVRPDGLLLPVSLSVLSAKRISRTKSVKAFQAQREAVRAQSFPFMVVHKEKTWPRLTRPPTENVVQFLRMQFGFHPDDQQFDHLFFEEKPT